MILPLNLSLMATDNNRLRKIFLGILAATIIAGVLCSNSRATLLDIMVSSAFLTLLFWKKIPKIILIVAIVSVVLFTGLFLDEVLLYLRIQHGLSYRTIIWDNSLEMLKSQPAFGCGLGNFYNVYIKRYGFPSIVDVRAHIKNMKVGGIDKITGFHAHNVFLHYAVETGIFSILLLCMFYGTYLKKSLPALKYKNSMNPDDYGIIAGCCAMLTGNFVHSFFEALTNFYNIRLSITFVLITASGMALLLNTRATLTDDGK